MYIVKERIEEEKRSVYHVTLHIDDIPVKICDEIVTENFRRELIMDAVMEAVRVEVEKLVKGLSPADFMHNR